MAIGKYKLLFQTNSLPRAWTIFESKLLHFVHTREKRKEKRKTLHLFVSSPSTCFIGHPLSTSRTRHSNAFSPLFFLFFHEVASLSGYRINPSPGFDNVETGSWRSSSPPCCNTGYPIEHRSSFPLHNRYLVSHHQPCFLILKSKIVIYLGRRLVHFPNFNINLNRSIDRSSNFQIFIPYSLKLIIKIWIDRSIAQFSNLHSTFLRINY